MSRILMLLPSDPTARDSGARIRNAGLLEILREEHEVQTLLAPPKPRSLRRRLADMAVSDLPDMAQRLWSPMVAKAVWESGFDAVQAEGIEMARYLWCAPAEQRVYDAHNAEFLLQRRLAETSFGLGSLYSRIQWRRLARFEARLVRESRMGMAVSEHDANQLLALAGPSGNVHVVPNAIDVNAYPMLDPQREVPPNLLFVGKLDFRPNAEALRGFVREVLPHLAGVRLFAVGGAPPEWLVKTGQLDQRVAVTGYVADERPYFARAAALILPIRTGGGSRFKALIAMASGLPIISTRLGMEGIEAEPDRHYLRADSRDEWLGSIRGVLSDATLRKRLAINAHELVRDRYDWSAVRPRLRAAYAWLSD